MSLKSYSALVTTVIFVTHLFTLYVLLFVAGTRNLPVL